jgi:hypothetical protein
VPLGTAKATFRGSDILFAGEQQNSFSRFTWESWRGVITNTQASKGKPHYILSPASLHSLCSHSHGVDAFFFESAHAVLQCCLPFAA